MKLKFSPLDSAGDDTPKQTLTKISKVDIEKIKN